MIGDPLLHVQRPVTLPGRPHPNPVTDVARTMIKVVLWATFAVWLFAWATADPMPDCVYDGIEESCIDPAG